MSREARRVFDYLGHILQAIERIEGYTSDLTRSAFSETALVQDAVVRNLEVVGEASRNIERHAPDFAAAHPELPLTIAYEMRNVLSHGYFSIDPDVVCTTIRTDPPKLKAQVRALLSGSAQEPPHS
jgi:uncharacterized protein with HEPN domain